MQTSDISRRAACSLCLLAQATLLVLVPAASLAQPAEGQKRAVEEVAGQPFIDRQVGSSLERFSRWQARMKAEHFTEYLMAYTALTAAMAGLFFGFAAYRLSDPLAPYRLIKRRSLQLALAVGGTLGIFAAVIQVPPNTVGKVSLLLLATGTGAIVTSLATWIAFILLRHRSNRCARLDGRRITDRMRHA